MTKYSKMETAEAIAALRKIAPDGAKVTRLHQTDVVREYPEGHFLLHSGGWRTKTTKDRIELALPPCYRIDNAQGSWSVVHCATGSPWSPENPRVPYFDGIKVPDCFTSEKMQAKGARAVKAEQKLRLQIRDFVKRNLPAKRETIPMPSGRDCWVCAREANKLLTACRAAHADKGHDFYELMGGLKLDSTSADHIREHVKENYFHGTLLFAAMLWRGNKGVSDHGPTFLRMFPIDTLRRTLKSYLYARLGLYR